MAAPRVYAKKSRNWCFTLNNYTDDHLKALDLFYTIAKDGKKPYIIYGKEGKDEGQTPHLQGYIHFAGAVTFGSVTKLLPNAHVEDCKGSPQQNIDYCSKEGDITQYGDPPRTQQKANKDNAAHIIALAEAGDLDSIKELYPKVYLQRMRTLEAIATANMKQPDDLEDVCGLWIYGESGSGKTHKARNEYGTYFPKTCNKWWDGYNGQDAVVVEDVDPKQAEHLGYYFKLWADKWSFVGEVKNSTRWLRPKRIIFTSQYSIEEVFPNQPETVAALNRRCEVIHLHKELKQAPPPKKRKRDMTAADVVKLKERAEEKKRRISDQFMQIDHTEDPIPDHHRQ